MHHSDVIAHAAARLGTGHIDLHRDALAAAAHDLDPCHAPEVVQRARVAVAEHLSALHGRAVEPDRWADGCVGWESLQIAGLLGVVANLSQPKELTQ